MRHNLSTNQSNGCLVVHLDIAQFLQVAVILYSVLLAFTHQNGNVSSFFDYILCINCYFCRGEQYFLKIFYQNMLIIGKKYVIDVVDPSVWLCLCIIFIGHLYILTVSNNIIVMLQPLKIPLSMFNYWFFFDSTNITTYLQLFPPPTPQPLVSYYPPLWQQCHGM